MSVAYNNKNLKFICNIVNCREGAGDPLFFSGLFCLKNTRLNRVNILYDLLCNKGYKHVGFIILKKIS